MPPTSATSRLERLPAVERKVLVANRKLCADWLEWLRAHGRKPITVYQYGAKCDELLECLGTKRLADVTLGDLENWISRPRKGRGQGALGADSTRAKEVDLVRGLWKWANAHGHLLTNPTLDLERPRVRNEDPKAIPVELWHQFWVSPTLTDAERVAFGLGFFCGLRRDEICRLEVRHVVVASGRITDFPRKGDRGKKRSGDVPLVSLARMFAQEHPRLLSTPEAFLEPLWALREAQRAAEARWLLPWGAEAAAMPQAWRGGPPHKPYGGGSRPVPDGMTSPDQVNHRLRYALKRAGMPERAFTPHALRHSFVTYLLRASVPLEVVSKLANHSSLDITLRYHRLADDPLAEMLDGCNNLRGSRW